MARDWGLLVVFKGRTFVAAHSLWTAPEPSPFSLAEVSSYVLAESSRGSCCRVVNVLARREHRRQAQIPYDVVEHRNERTHSNEARIVAVHLAQIFRAMHRSAHVEDCVNGGVEVHGCPWAQADRHVADSLDRGPAVW